MNSHPRQHGVGQRLDELFLGRPHGDWELENGSWSRVRQLVLRHSVELNGIETPAEVRVSDEIHDSRARAVLTPWTPKRPPLFKKRFVGRSLSIETFTSTDYDRVLNDVPGAMNGMYDLELSSGNLTGGVVRLETNRVDNGDRLPEFIDRIHGLPLLDFSTTNMYAS